MQKILVTEIPFSAGHDGLPRLSTLRKLAGKKPISGYTGLWNGTPLTNPFPSVHEADRAAGKVAIWGVVSSFRAFDCFFWYDPRVGTNRWVVMHLSPIRRYTRLNVAVTTFLSMTRGGGFPSDIARIVAEILLNTNELDDLLDARLKFVTIDNAFGVGFDQLAAVFTE